MRVDHDQSDLKTEPKAQEGTQINIIADKTYAITIITIIHNVHVDLSLKLTKKRLN